MTVKGITVKFILFALLCGVFTYLVPACSTGKQITGFSNIWGTAEARPGLADEDLTRAMAQLRPHPGNAEAHYQLGCWYQQRGRHQEAIKEFKKAIFIKPDYTEAYNGLGVSHDSTGEYAAASDAYRMALKLNPNLGYIYNNLGHSYILQGKNAEAIDALKQAIALGDNNKRTYNNLGLAYALSGQLELAVQEFARTGDKAHAHALAAKIYYQRGQFKNARKHYSEALELDPDSVSSQRGLETSTLLARFDEVLAQLKQAIAGAVSEEPVQTTQTEALEDASKSYTTVGVEISNGNGASNMARSVGRYLKEKGFNIVRLTNADHFNYPRTTLMHKPECKDASQELAGQLPEMPTVKEVKKLDRPTVQMKMVLGKDIVPHKNAFAEEK